MRHPAIQFLGTPDPNKPGQIMPVAPLDNRFTGMTAQFYAGSSYGPLHQTVINLTNSHYASSILQSLQGQPIFAAFTNIETGFEAGAAQTSAAFHDPQLTPTKKCNPCMTLEWEKEWSRAFFYYNGEVFYQASPAQVVTQGLAKYDPN
ncbi:MAG: hypothetical protein ACRD4H_10710 [Candidatus Acidiferrales bacterium]